MRLGRRVEWERSTTRTNSPSRFFSSLSLFPSCHPFISLPLDSPSQRDARTTLAGERRREKKQKKKHPALTERETGNLSAPASGSEIKAVFQMSQKHCRRLTSCTCDRLAAATLLVLGARKRLAVTLLKDPFMGANHVSKFITWL